MRALVTGGAGFIGCWVVRELIENNWEVVVFDNLSNGAEENLSQVRAKLKELIIGDIRDKNLIKSVFKGNFDVCFHLAAQVNVQDSIDNPRDTFDINIAATFDLMEEAKNNNVKMVFVSSALVYDTMKEKPIDEQHFLKSSCPYAASKIAGENIVLSYFYAYKFPVVVVRPFSAYGPYQRPDMEGGVVSIFSKRKLSSQPLEVFGDGTQTRDFFFVKDCAEFIAQCATQDKANGEVFNIGSGKDVSIKNLAKVMAPAPDKVRFVPHHHPQSEISKMICDWSKAKTMFGWSPKISLGEGLAITEMWVKSRGSL